MSHFLLHISTWISNKYLQPNIAPKQAHLLPYAFSTHGFPPSQLITILFLELLKTNLRIIFDSVLSFQYPKVSENTISSTFKLPQKTNSSQFREYYPSLSHHHPSPGFLQFPQWSPCFHYYPPSI